MTAELSIVRKLTEPDLWLRVSNEGVQNIDSLPVEAATLIRELFEALECLLGRFCEIDAERGNDSEKQSEVIIARAALAEARKS